jgi:hypothetical protein
MTYLDTPIDATVTAYSPNYSSDQIKQMVYDLGVIAKENERFRLDVGSLRKQLNEGQACIESAKEIIIEAIKIDRIGKDVLINVAEALDITLVNNYDVTITVTYQGTIEIPAGQDIESFEQHVDFEFSAPFSDEWEFDIYQEGVEIDYKEA